MLSSCLPTLDRRQSTLQFSLSAAGLQDFETDHFSRRASSWASSGLSVLHVEANAYIVGRVVVLCPCILV